MENAISKERGDAHDLVSEVYKKIEENQTFFEGEIQKVSDESTKGIKMIENLIEFMGNSFGDKFQVKNTYHIDLAQKIEDLHKLIRECDDKVEEVRQSVLDIPPPQEIKLPQTMGEADFLGLLKDFQSNQKPGLSIEEVKKEIEESNNSLNTTLTKIIKEQEESLSNRITEAVKVLDFQIKSDSSNNSVYIKQLKDKLA